MHCERGWSLQCKGGFVGRSTGGGGEQDEVEFARGQGIGGVGLTYFMRMVKSLRTVNTSAVSVTLIRKNSCT